MSDGVVQQWTEPRAGETSAVETSTFEVTGVGEPRSLAVVTRGDVPDDGPAYAAERLGAVIEEIGEPVLFARVKLTQAGDPARERPAIAQVSVDVNGRVLRAHLAAHSMREAIDLLQRRLRDKVEHHAQRREARRRRPAASELGEWRHGDAPTQRPEYFDRPTDEREVVCHKAYEVDELAPDEAAFDLEQGDFDFYLFRDVASGEDALLERTGDGTYRLTRLHPADVGPAPTAIDLSVVEHPAPQLTLADAIERMGSSDAERCLFFADTATGRGTVLYHRYDGHYGLITPE